MELLAIGLLTFLFGYALGYEASWRKAQREARFLVEMARKFTIDSAVDNEVDLWEQHNNG